MMLKSLTLALGVLLAFTSHTVNALYSAGDDVLQLDEKTFDKTGKYGEEKRQERGKRRVGLGKRMNKELFDKYIPDWKILRTLQIHRDAVIYTLSF